MILIMFINGLFDFKMIVTIFLLFLLVFLYKLRFKSRIRLPGPFPWPLIGNCLSFGKSTHLKLHEWKKRYGPIFRMKIGSHDVIVLNDYRTIKEALVLNRKCFSGRPRFPSFSNVSQGKGVVFNDSTTQGDNWKIAKNFMVKNIHKLVKNKEYQSTLLDHIHLETVELIEELMKMSSSDPSQAIHVSVANIACSFVFGRRYDHKNKNFQSLITLNKEFGSVVGSNNQIDTMPWLQYIPKFKRQKESFESLNKRVTNWAKARIEEHHANPPKSNNLFKLMDETRDEEHYDDDKIAAFVTDVFGATQDTTSTLLKWIIAYLLHFPGYQIKIKEEIDMKLGERHRLRMDEELPLLSAFIHEVNRHSSFISITIPHLTINDVSLGGYKIPKETLIFLNQYSANHDESEWKNPEDFDPSRFLDHNGNIDANLSRKYLIFSLGARRCPGDKLSWIFVVHLVVTLLSVCSLETPFGRKPPSLNADYSLTMMPGPYSVKILIRDPNRLNHLKKKVYFSDFQKDFVKNDSDRIESSTIEGLGEAAIF